MNNTPVLALLLVSYCFMHFKKRKTHLKRKINNNNDLLKCEQQHSLNMCYLY